MKNIIRVSLISLSLALIIMILDGSINFKNLQESHLDDIIEVLIGTQIFGLILYFVLRLVDTLILDRFNVNSNRLRVEVYMLVCVIFTAIFVYIVSKVFLTTLSFEKQNNEAYMNGKYISAFIAGYLYLIYGVASYLSINWINNKLKLRKYLKEN